MKGYKLRGDTSAGKTVDIPLAATTDDEGNEIKSTYATKEELADVQKALDEKQGKITIDNSAGLGLAISDNKLSLFTINTGDLDSEFFTGYPVTVKAVRDYVGDKLETKQDTISVSSPVYKSGNAIGVSCGSNS